jgi:hypothetical protein
VIWLIVLISINGGPPGVLDKIPYGDMESCQAEKAARDSRRDYFVEKMACQSRGKHVRGRPRGASWLARHGGGISVGATLPTAGKAPTAGVDVAAGARRRPSTTGRWFLSPASASRASGPLGQGADQTAQWADTAPGWRAGRTAIEGETGRAFRS